MCACPSGRLRQNRRDGPVGRLDNGRRSAKRLLDPLGRRRGDLIRVLVGATSAIVRAGLESLVRESPGTALAGGSSSPATVARQIETVQPDVLLIELERDSAEGAAALSALGGPSRAGGPPAVDALA